MSTDPIIHPVQGDGQHKIVRLREEVVLRAYEVYCHIYSPQAAMIDVAKGCRGGFAIGEIVAFLYARSFPQEEWSKRVQEAFEGMKAR